MSPKHTRLIELLRFIYRSGGVARIDHIDLYEFLAHRGVMDPDTHIIRDRGGAMPTRAAKALVHHCVSTGLDLGLIDRWKNNNPRRSSRNRHVYKMTMDGKETLLDWDDPESEGLWPG